MSTEGYRIVLVSGFGNETEDVIAAHKGAAAAWQALGIDTQIIHPDYSSSDLSPVLAEIHATKQEGIDRGWKVTKVGSSGGGSFVLAEEIIYAVDGQLPGKNVTICSRMDLIGAADLCTKSPVLAKAVTLVGENKDTFPFTAANTLCFTAGEVDGVVPAQSSILPHALTQPITGRGVMNHFRAVEAG